MWFLKVFRANLKSRICRHGKCSRSLRRRVGKSMRSDVRALIVTLIAAIANWNLAMAMNTNVENADIISHSNNRSCFHFGGGSNG
jgi:hypothetical protein